MKRVKIGKNTIDIDEKRLSCDNLPSCISIITLPQNGMADVLCDNQIKIFEDESNLKIALGSPVISEALALSCFVDNILNDNTDLTNYSKVVTLDGIPNEIYREVKNAHAAAARILATPNAYSAADVKDGGKCYYVSYSMGDDSNDGLSPEAPWKTIHKVSSECIPAGSVVLFKRGDIWRFDDYSFNARAGYFILQSNVIYSSYGEGAKPAIYGSPVDAAREGEWTETKVKNVWRYSREYVGMDNAAQNDVGIIVFNGGEAYGYKMIKGQPEITFNGTLEELDSNFKYWYNPEDNHVYLYCDGGNPAEKFDSIEIGVRLNMVRAAGNCTNIIFDNFEIKYGGAHAITIATSDKITVKNCVAAWIGGGVYTYAANSAARYGNGVEINRDSRDITIDNNYFYQIYDAGVTHQYDSRGNPSCTTTCYMENIDYTNNVMEYCFYGIEFFVGEAVVKDIPRYMKNIKISGNSIMYSGYGWGTWRKPSGVPAATAVKAWNNLDSTVADAENGKKTIQIVDNKFIISKYDMIYGVYENIEDVPNVEGNVFIQCSTGKTVTLETSDVYFDEKINRRKIRIVPVSDRKPWNEQELLEHEYLKDRNNRFYTVY